MFLNEQTCDFTINLYQKRKSSNKFEIPNTTFSKILQMFEKLIINFEVIIISLENKDIYLNLVSVQLTEL